MGGADGCITEATTDSKVDCACVPLAMHACASTRRQEVTLAAGDAAMGVVALAMGVGCGDSGLGCCATANAKRLEMKRPGMTADARASAARPCSVGDRRPVWT